MNESPQNAATPKRDGDKIHVKPPRPGSSGGVVPVGFDIKDPNRFDLSATK